MPSQNSSGIKDNSGLTSDVVVFKRQEIRKAKHIAKLFLIIIQAVLGLTRDTLKTIYLFTTVRL